MNVILFGHKSCGKTYIGQLLSQRLGLPFIDIDRLIECLHQEEFQEHFDCKTIVLKRGIDGFRTLENRVIYSLTANQSVIAVGGGTLLNPENRLKLETLGQLIYLEVDKETIRRRIFQQGLPSFLDPHHPERSFEKMYEERQSIYEKTSPYKVSLTGKTCDQILQELEQIITNLRNNVINSG